MPIYTLRLHQHAWVNTENFEVEAADEAAARAEVDKIAESKGLEKDFKFEIVQHEDAAEPDQPADEPQTAQEFQDQAKEEPETAVDEPQA